MKRIGSAVGMAALLAVASCTQDAGEQKQDRPEAPATRTAPVGASGQTAAPVQPAAQGAPEFAVVYPGGQLQDDAVTASDTNVSGGLVTYLTDASPGAVIEFHKQRAEAEGLASVMAMNQGDARAYGAARDETNVQVVAAPTPDGRTSVQLSWSAPS